MTIIKPFVMLTVITATFLYRKHHMEQKQKGAALTASPRPEPAPHRILEVPEHWWD